jgi:protoporphyrin/coproporphyrin ferrochelatase
VTQDAVLLMAYGTPGSPEEIEPYYTDIRRGNPPPPDLLADLVRRYGAIGGVSPLAERTRAQAAGLAAALEQRGAALPVTIGLKHAAPKIEAAVDELVASGVRRIVGLVLAPHYSRGSVQQYLDRARARGAEVDPGVEVLGIESWHLEPTYLDFLAAGVRARLDELPARTKVLFTAHSLPQRVVAGGDPYPEQLRATAEAVAERVGLLPWSGWAVAWQSAGRTADPWLGPDVLEVLRDLAATGRAEGALVCPCGFVADHLEVLYDLDIEARGRADELGLAFARTPVLNGDPAVLGALADRVLALLP